MKYKRPAVFLDRDGVLNRDVGFVYRPDQFEWIDGAVCAIHHLNMAKYYVFVVTNQSGIARGYYTESEVQFLHQWVNERLFNEGAHIDAFYFCPHHPNGEIKEYRRLCKCRKPEPGLLLDAMVDWQVDRDRSFLVGDKTSDLVAADRAGIESFQFKGGNLFDFIKDLTDKS